MRLYEQGAAIITSEYACNLTPTLAFENSKDNIRAIIKVKGTDYPIMIVTKMLKECLELIKHNLTVNQMAGYAEMFVKNNPTLKIDEIILILKKGAKGDFGQHQGFFDYHVLNDWLGFYEKNERANYFERRSYTAPVGDSRRTSAHGESIGKIAKDSISKINESKDSFKESAALKNYKKSFRK